MVRHILSAAVLALAGMAQASPVLDRSSYGLFLEGESSLTQSYFQVSFDGRKEWFERSGRDISVEETSTDLGGGRWQIDVHVWTNVPLFPQPGEAGMVGLGMGGDGFDLDGHYRLEGFTLAYSDPDGASFTSLNLADVFRSHFADPWDGATPSVIMAPLGGQYTELQMRFVLAPANNVPEPGGLALAGLGLAALGRRLRGRAMMA